MERIAEASSRFKARMAGVFQLLEALTATFGQVIIRDKLVVTGNAAATAANILGHEPLFWLGFASSLIGVAFHIAWAALMYQLLKPVNRSLSLLAAFVILVPPLAYRLFFPYIAVASALGEIPLELWLMVMGVNAQRWKVQASAAVA